MKILLVHHNDVDGFMAGAYIYRNYVYDENMDYNEMTVMSYNREPIKDVKEFLENTKKPDMVIMADVSLPIEIVKGLLEEKVKVVWHDHHKSTLDKYIKAGMIDENIELKPVTSGDYGENFHFEYSTTMSASMLCTAIYDINKSEWFFKLLCLVNACDIHDTSYKDWKKAVDVYYELETHYDDFMYFFRLLDASYEDYMDIYKKGNAIKRAKDKEIKETAERSFLLTWEGHHWIACNHIGSYEDMESVFEKYKNNYEGVLYFMRLAEQWKVSMYAGDNEFLDCSEIAVKHNGGGHKGAASFLCDELPF